MSIAKGTFSLKCSTCGKQYDFSEDDADFENTSLSERQMGPENEHSWELIFYCDKCGNEIDVEYDVWEYPIGDLNMDEVKIKGGTKVSLYSYDFHC
jgi:hypothetical protein